MDAKMKGMIVTGLMVGCLALGLMAQFGSSWLTEDTDESENNSGLHEMNATPKADGWNADMCKAMVEGSDSKAVSCDGEVMITEYATLHDECTDAIKDAKAAGATDEMLKDSQDDCDDIGAMADSGSYGGMILWVGSVAAIVGALLLILSMAGVDVDAVPDKVGMITMWAAGGLTILAVLVWYMLLPDTDSDSVLGMSGYMAIIAGVMGLAAGGMDTFMAADDDGGGDAAPAE